MAFRPGGTVYTSCETALAPAQAVGLKKTWDKANEADQA